MIRRWTPGQWALRGTVVAGVLVALMATGPAGVWPAPWLMVLVGGLAVAFALVPETPIGTVAIGLVLAWWGVAFRDSLHPQALVAAAGLLAAHVAALLTSYGPGELAVDPGTVRRWALRAAAVFLVAPLVWLVAEGVRGEPEPVGIWVAGLGVAFVATLAASVAYAAGQER